MKFLTDHCINKRVRMRLKARGIDCLRWDWVGDPTARDPEIAATADAQDRAVISDNWDFLDWRQHHKPIFGYHVHLIGPKREAPDLIERRIDDLIAKMDACGVGIYIVKGDEPIIFEKGPVA